MTAARKGPARLADPPPHRPAPLSGRALPDRPLRLHPLRYLDEGDRVVIGRTDTDSYGVFPPDGAGLLRELERGRTPAQAATWYAEHFGEPIDVAAFVATLHELAFVETLSEPALVETLSEPALVETLHEPLVETVQESPFVAPGNPAQAGTIRAGTDAAHPVRWQRLGAALFSPVAWVCYGLLTAGAVAACVADPRMLPVRGHVFFTRYLVIVELTLLVGQFPITVLHELFHVLAGRRLGLNSSMRLGYRLYFVVAETRLDGLVVVPRRRRYLPILAGMLADVLVTCLLTVAAWLTRHPDGSLPLFGRIALALAFTCLFGVAGQFYFFLRTDVYYLVTTVLGCVDLHGAARAIVRNRWWRLRRRPDRCTDENLWDPRDRRAARWYGPLYLAGYLLMFVMLAVVAIPLAIRFLGTALRTVLTSGAPPARFWDAALFLSLFAIQLAVAGGLAVRNRHRPTTTAAEATPPEPTPPEPTAPELTARPDATATPHATATATPDE